MARHDPLACLEAELARFWNDILQQRFPSYAPPRGAFRPAVDVLETPEEIVVRIELAGARPKNVRVSVLDRRLVVDGVRPEPAAAASGAARYLRKEIAFGPFQALVELPRPIDVERANARFEDGLLVIRMPQTGPPEPHAEPERTLRTVTITLHL